MQTYPCNVDGLLVLVDDDALPVVMLLASDKEWVSHRDQ